MLMQFEWNCSNRTVRMELFEWNCSNRTVKELFERVFKFFVACACFVGFKQKQLLVQQCRGVLCEISIISETLQKRDVTIVQAAKWIRRTILHLENLKDHKKGKKLLKAASGIDKMELFSIPLTKNPKTGVRHRNQFLKSFIYNMKYECI